MKYTHIKILLRIVLFACVLGLSLLACEFFTRIFHLSKTYASYIDSAGAGPAAGYIAQRNIYGWRDREFAITKGPNIYRIACIGDSVTEGYRAPLESTFPKALEVSFKSRGYDIEVMNLGKAGNNTLHNLSSVNEAMKFQADLIIYQFGLNDIEGLEHFKKLPAGDIATAADMSSQKKEESGTKPFLRKSAFYLALAERYNYIRLKLGFRTWAFDEWKATEAMWQQDFDRIKKVFDEARPRLKIYMIYIPYDYEVYSRRKEVRDSSRRISVFCRVNGLYFLDFTDIFKRQKDRYGIFLDDCHLSIRGHKIVAQYLEDSILHNAGGLSLPRVY